MHFKPKTLLYIIHFNTCVRDSYENYLKWSINIRNEFKLYYFVTNILMFLATVINSIVTSCLPSMTLISSSILSLGYQLSNGGCINFTPCWKGFRSVKVVIGKSFGIPKEDSNVQHALNGNYMRGIILNILYELNNSILILTF